MNINNSPMSFAQTNTGNNLKPLEKTSSEENSNSSNVFLAGVKRKIFHLQTPTTSDDFITKRLQTVSSLTSYFHKENHGSPSDCGDKYLKDFYIRNLEFDLRSLTITQYNEGENHPSKGPYTFDQKTLYDQLKMEAQKIKLEPDPIIKLMGEPELSQVIIKIQTDFQEQGFSRFKSEHLKVPVRNMLAVLNSAIEQGKQISNHEDGIKDPLAPPSTHKKTDHRQLQQLEVLVKKLETQNHHPKPLYKDVLHLSIKYALMIDIFKTMPYIDDENKANTMKLINYIDFSEEYVFGSDEWSELLSEMIGSDVLFCKFEKIFQYCRGKYRYLAWPTFEPLNLKLFVYASRYSIMPAGLLPGTIAYNDNTIMNCFTFMHHDILHLHQIESFFRDLYGEYGQPEIVQAIIDKIIRVMNTDNLDALTREAVILWLFYFSHEAHGDKTSPKSLILLQSERATANEESLFSEITYGYYETSEGLQFKHLKQGYNFLNKHFPV